MRKHRFVMAAALSLTLAIGTVPGASADDPEQDKAAVEQQLTQAQVEVQESTAAVAAAAAALSEVDGQLAVAQQSLLAAQGQLDTARAEDQRLAAEFAAAQTEETVAESALVDIQAHIDADQDVLTELARSAYQGGQLSQVSALLESDSFGAYVERSEGMRSVLRTQSAVIGALADSRAQQATTQATLEAARERAAAARVAAATILLDKKRLEREAAAAQAEVERLHLEREKILADAQASLAADEAEYRALEVERTRLEVLLAERAAAQAAAAAAARAAAAAAAAAAAEAGAPAPQSFAPPVRASDGVFYRPVGGWVTSSYGMRLHPITGVYKLHDGTDFGDACGVPIRAAASGTVLSAYYSGGYGNQTVIEHGDIGGAYVATSYNHQSAFAVSPGEQVDRGEVIGYVGTTGLSTGCHLHFMTYVNGATTDPMNYL